MTYSLDEYAEVARKTDKFEAEEIHPILLGLFGEVGSVMSAVKKLKREKKTYAEFRDNVVDELGDVFWYLTALARRANISLPDLVEKDDIDDHHDGDEIVDPLSTAQGIEALKKIGNTSSQILHNYQKTDPNNLSALKEFVRNYLDILNICKINFSEVLKKNMQKIRSCFLEPDFNTLPDFDKDFPECEQLPREFTIEMFHREDGSVHPRWNGVFIGSPLKDNAEEEDGFRYHDVIHFANAAILHWSPAMRSLIKQKRKSNKEIDESQDGGRAFVTEEGLAVWLFSKAKNLNYFDECDTIPLDLLKIIQDIVRGREVEECPLKLWEHCILTAFGVIRKLRANKCGFVIGNRYERTLVYKKELDT